MRLVVQYTIYSTRGVVSCLIKHSASPRALSATRPLLSCCKSRTALRERINYNIKKSHSTAFGTIATHNNAWLLSVSISYNNLILSILYVHLRYNCAMCQSWDPSVRIDSRMWALFLMNVSFAGITTDVAVCALAASVSTTLWSKSR